MFPRALYLAPSLVPERHVAALPPLLGTFPAGEARVPASLCCRVCPRAFCPATPLVLEWLVAALPLLLGTSPVLIARFLASSAGETRFLACSSFSNHSHVRRLRERVLIPAVHAFCRV